MQLQFLEDSIGQTFRDFLRNLGMSAVPIFGSRFNGQVDALMMAATDRREMPDIYLSNQFEPALRGFF